MKLDTVLERLEQKTIEVKQPWFARDTGDNEAVLLVTHSDRFKVLTPYAIKSLLNCCDVPSDFFSRRIKDQDLRLNIINHCRPDRMFAVLGGEDYVEEFRTGPRPAYSNILSAALKRAELPKDLEVKNFSICNGVTRIMTIDRNISAQPRSGDVIYGGIGLSLNHKVEVEISIFRQICKNGAVTQLQGGSFALEVSPEHSQNDLTDFAAMALRNAYKAIPTTLKSITELDHKRVWEDPFRGLKIAKSYRQVIRQAMREDAEVFSDGYPTYYDLFNAVSWAATHAHNVRDSARFGLMRTAGQVTRVAALVKCPACRGKGRVRWGEHKGNEQETCSH